MTPEQPQGIFLSELGNLTHPATPEGKTRLEAVVSRAFKDAGAQKHGPPQFFWSKGETMAAFKAEIMVEKLEPLCNMPRLDG